jgi:hypothetical protein
MYISTLLLFVFGLGFVVFLLWTRNEKNDSLRWYIILGQLVLFVLFCVTLLYAVGFHYEGYPTSMRVRDGVYQKVATTTSSSGEQYLLAYEPSGQIRLFSLRKEDDITSSTLWLKACPFKRSDRGNDDLFFRPLVMNKSTAEITCVPKF